MAKLKQMLIERGLGYWFTEARPDKSVVELAEYSGEKELVINCTQLDGCPSAKERKRILSEWCNFLSENPHAFTELRFGTRMPQQLFNAVCEQKDLKRLSIKWGVYPDLSTISKLQKLEYLHIGSGAGVLSVEPLAELKNLVMLSVENFQKISDYSALTALNNLEMLSISGDVWSPQYIHIDSLDFLGEMKQLRSFSLEVARVKSKDYTPILGLENVEFLTVESRKEVKAIYDKLIKLPKLKYGMLIENPELYRL